MRQRFGLNIGAGVMFLVVWSKIEPGALAQEGLDPVDDGMIASSDGPPFDPLSASIDTSAAGTTVGQPAGKAALLTDQETDDRSPTGRSCPRETGRDTLPSGDGWASLGSGTTGGALASPTQVYVVTTRAELIAALNNGVPSVSSPATPSDQPKIIYVEGTIDFNTSDAGAPLVCTDYYRNGFTREAFLAAYDPAVWGRGAPTGALEVARVASRNAQQERVRIRVGSNTTLIGRGRNARLRGVWLDLRGTPNVSGSRSNIIIRRLSFEDTFDCFPEWAPTDGALGSWNALYDAISLRDTDHVWIDHNSFEDRLTADELQPAAFGVLFQGHDGLVDITNASDQVTVSWNRFRHHDKTMLIGSSDSAVADRGKLRVTLHHNVFEGVAQRAPRVRFGQVHVYNNLYRIVTGAPYVYSWGIGIESALRAENNVFEADPSPAGAQAPLPSTFLQPFKGTSLYEAGTLFADGSCAGTLVSIVDAWNGANDPDLGNVASWTPVTPAAAIEDAVNVRASVRAGAGARGRDAHGGDR